MNQAETHFQAALAIARRLDDGYLLMNVYNCLAHLASTRGDHRASSRSYLAICWLALGQEQEALRLSAQAISELEAAPGGEEPLAIYFHHWRIVQAAGQGDDARAVLEHAYLSGAGRQPSRPVVSSKGTSAPASALTPRRTGPNSTRQPASACPRSCQARLQ
ncbi:MAG: hypothetical protein ACE5H9_05855 [Anaerolineae bacterium]